MKKIKLSLLVAFFMVISGYTYFWYLAANKLEMAVIDQVRILSDKGYRVAYGAIRVKGFPLKINLEIDDPFIEIPDPVAASFSVTGTLHGYSFIFSPTDVRFFADQGVEIKTALLKEGDNTVLHAAGLMAEMSLKNPFQNFTLTFQRPHIGAIDIKANTLRLGLKLHEKNKDLDRYSFEMIKIDPSKKLVPGFPQTIENIKADLSLKGRVRVDAPLERSLNDWYESEGILDIGTLSMTWGDLKVDLNGTVALDQTLQPLAALSAEIYGLNEILTKLSELGFIHENILPILKASLNFLKESKQSDKGKNIYHKVAVTLQDNDVVIGSIPVVKFPPINWSNIGE